MYVLHSRLDIAKDKINKLEYISEEIIQDIALREK